MKNASASGNIAGCHHLRELTFPYGTSETIGSGRTETSTKPARYLPYGLSLLYVVAVLRVFLLAAAASPDPTMCPVDASADRFYSTLSAVYFVAHTFLASQWWTSSMSTRSATYIYAQHCLVRATILSVIYLQYEMNRLPAPVDGICQPPEDI